MLERLLPMPMLLGCFSFIAGARALASRLFKGNRSLQLRPPWLPAEAPFRAPFLDRFQRYLNRPLMFFPERLAHKKWQRRCRYVGLEHLRSESGAILAFLHFGPYPLLRGWLRAAGVPASMLVSYPAGERSPALLRHHRQSLFPEIPPTFHLENLPAALRHLKAGHPLAMALDSANGRQMEVDVGDQWSFMSATGAVRIARRHRVPLVACSIYCEGPWRFVIEVSPPVPDEVWQRGDDAAGAHLMEQFLPLLRRYPEQCLLRLVQQIGVRKAAPPLAKIA